MARGGKGTGKPCGASHIARNKKCTVNLPTAVGKVLHAASGEIGAASIKEAVRLHAGPQGMQRLREIRAEIRGAEGGNIVKGPKADELKKRLQAEGLLPNGKAKSVAPEMPENLRKELAALPLKTDIRDELARLAAQGQDRKPKVVEWNPPALQSVPTKVKAKPDELYGAWETGGLKRQKKWLEAQLASGKAKGVEEQVRRISAELKRREGGEKEGKGETDRMMSDLSRLMKGESPKYMDIVDASGEAGAGARMKSQRVVDGPKTAASTGTKYARENARNFDDQIQAQQLRRDGDKTFDRWDETTGTGAKKLGSGAYGTVIRTGDKSYAVKRGDISDTEALLIQKLGDANLGPKLIAADVDGPGRMTNPGVDVRSGRLAMSIVPGSPIGKKKPDKEIGGVKVADAYWTARAKLHRMGIAHNDMHIDNVMIDRKGVGRFVDMGLAQDNPKAALSEALGAFEPPKGSNPSRGNGGAGGGDWQVKRWDGTGGQLLATYERKLNVNGMPLTAERARKELEEKAPLLYRVRDNKNELQYRMLRDGFSKDDIATVIDHGLRNPLSTYDNGVWSRMTNEQAQSYIETLYEGV